MPELFLQSIFMALLRHAMTAAAGGTFTMGLVSNDMKQQVLGAGMGVVAMIWSMIQKAGRPVIAGWLRQYADRLNPPNNPIISAPPVPDLSTVSRFR